MDKKYIPLVKKLGLGAWFSQHEMEIFTKMQYTPESVSEEEWQEIYKKYKNNESVVDFLAGNTETPYDIIKSICHDTNIVDTRIILEREDLQDKEIEAILTKAGVAKIARTLQINITLGYSPFSKNVINYILNSELPYKYPALSFCNDIKYIEKIMDENPENEEITNAIANNIAMPNRIREQAFNLGADWEYVNAKTSYMKKEIYRQFIDTIFDYEAKETTDKVAIDKAMEKLCEAIKKGELTDSSQIDLISRVKDLYDDRKEKILTELAKYTKSPNVLQTITDVSNNTIKRECTRNENASQELLNNRIEYLIGRNNGIPDDSVEYWDNIAEMKDIIMKAELAPLTYKRLLAKGEVQIINALVLSQNTIAKVLEKIMENKMGYGTDPTIAQIAIILKQKGLIQYIQNISDFTVKVMYQDSVQSQKFENIDAQYSHMLPHNMNNVKELKYLCDTLKELIPEIKDKKIAKGLEYYCRMEEDIISTGEAMRSATYIFQIGSSQKFSVASVENMRGGNYDKCKEQLAAFDNDALIRMQNIIVRRCEADVGELEIDGEPNEIPDTYLNIEGYSTVYGACHDTIYERKIQEFEKEYNVNDEER